MAWTAPRTWSVGEAPTAALFNAQVRDNLSILRQNTGNGDPAASGKVLRSTGASSTEWNTVAAGDLDASVFACCLCTVNADQNWTINTPMTVGWPVETYDTDSMHNTSTNTSRVTINTDGRYMFTIGLYIANLGSTTNNITVRLYRNGTVTGTVVATVDFWNLPTNGGVTLEAEGVFVEGEWVEVVVQADVTGRVGNDTTRSWIAAHHIAP